ncbi:hypothetical protein TNCV_4043251 [Trichonephila clavipes]|nr:hypothetical protein TNCV_4043251 [Trichonephila clavipes]
MVTRSIDPWHLQPHVLPLMQRLPGAIFQQDNAQPHMARVSQNCLRTVTVCLRIAPSMGLRTLELCVDNLQPEFLYDHIQPVRAELMQALWRTLRNPVDSVAQVAFRVLGKFGGGNRKMMIEPQRVCYCSSLIPFIIKVMILIACIF